MDAALLLRTLALFPILFQFRLLARDLADTPVFAAALVFAFLAAVLLAKRRIAPVPALLTLILAPWAARAGVVLLKGFFPAASITPNALLLNLDRNHFAALPPFYWAALSTFFSARSRRFLRADIIAADLLLLALFCIVPAGKIEAYRWPVLMVALFTGILFLQILAFMFSLPREYRLRKKEGIPAVCALFVLALLGGVLFLRPSQEGAVARSGGLLEPNLFRFDFTQYLKLESEISMKDDLVLILRKDRDDTHILLRRFVLSGYDLNRGFFRQEPIDEAAHPQRLPAGPVVFDDEGAAGRPPGTYRIASQEYFFVNLESQAFIALNKPLHLTPFNQWDASSFSSAYGVESVLSEALPFELAESVRGPLSAESLGLSAAEYAWYTEYGGDREIAAYAREITGGITNYHDQVEAVYYRLKYGEYRYSLKPGIAPDGDQLKFFLLQLKKGYCSYYAFSMALLLRSLGIPARVAVGFFIDPETNTLNYYPVRSNMAHAWVEVYYPGYGWIEYDPTSQIPAEGEDFAFSSGPPAEVFERLMKEILDNRSHLSPRQGTDAEAGPKSLEGFGQSAGVFFKHYGWLVFLAGLSLGFVCIRAGPLTLALCTGNRRKKAARLWAHAIRRLRLGGFRRPVPDEAGWARDLDGDFSLGLYALYQSLAAARYAPRFTAEDFSLFKTRYAFFRAHYHQAAPRWRRILAWFLPPLALVLPPKKGGKAGFLGVLLLPVLLAVLAGDTARAQVPDGEALRGPEALLAEAESSQEAELWERAIELYSRGAGLYPQDPRFPLALGNLYSGHRLFALAWDEYRKVETLIPENNEILSLLSRTAGYLSRTAVAAEYLERLLAREPDDYEAISNLAWMYYKLHRLEEGERLLLAARSRSGGDADFSMTLGTIYLAMFRYEDSKHWYREAIAGGEAVGDRNFTAVAYYNLSILESRFYQFSAAFDCAGASLASQDRPSGRLARGELFLRRLELPRVLSEYQEAYERDASPLAKVNLAQAYQIAGRLEEARLYAEDCLARQDLSWMLNYGIDPVQYRRDLHEILWETYGGLKNTQRALVYGSLKEKAAGLVRSLSYRFKEAVHRRLYQKYCFLDAQAYAAERSPSGEIPLDALIQYYHAFQSYPSRARTYLNRAAAFEAALIPPAQASYDLEEGTLLKDAARIRRGLERFDPVWERDMIAEGYAALAKISRGSEKTAAAEGLYALNPGALRQNGIALPVEFSIETRGFPGKTAPLEKNLRRALARSGIAPIPAARFRLTISAAPEGEARVELYDTGRGTAVLSRLFPLKSSAPGDISAFTRALEDELFKAAP
ncbi:MAG: tetratricopeptide repeat protein [Spirochaetaceae bacterium]|jgi:transglutaminase-like putative cysteine protease/tetratricopeptide (TPR) repeat protein|nr:tetratricopeptide repeat protein [Spirochaetaceae bacterium]